jgi:uncharacterized membrane protein YidH (DUF202 family)
MRLIATTLASSLNSRYVCVNHFTYSNRMREIKEELKQSHFTCIVAYICVICIVMLVGLVSSQYY